LQYFPVPQSGSLLHDFTHEPLTQLGASGDVHSASELQTGPPPPPPPGVGRHTPLSHVNPASHGFVSQLSRHWPSAQTWESVHSLEYLHVFSFAVHAPATQVNLSPQSFEVSHGHGPAFPPHASHVPALHALPSPQSAVVVHSLRGPGPVPGGEQSPSWQISPFGHCSFVEHSAAHPVAVQTVPGGQLALPVQAVRGGAFTREHPYASQSKHPVESQ
jgi:hypothetical protein